MKTNTSVRPNQPKMFTRFLVAGALTALTAVGLTVSGTSAADAATTTQASTSSATAASTSVASDKYEGRVKYWINVRRSHHGLKKLHLASCADKFAESWGKHLASNDEFYHQSMQKILNRCDAYYAGETLGRGATTAKQLVYLWMHSPEHREVLMSKNAHRIGVGAYTDSNGQWVVAADFIKL